MEFYVLSPLLYEPDAISQAGQLPNQHEGPRDTERNPPDFWINSVKDASWHLVTLVQ